MGGALTTAKLACDLSVLGIGLIDWRLVRYASR